MSECATLDHAKQTGIVVEKVAEMYSAADKATLLGPKEIHQPLDGLTSFLSKEYGKKSIKCPKPLDDEMGKIRGTAGQLYGKFMNAARNDLGVHPALHTMDEWSRILSGTN